MRTRAYSIVVLLGCISTSYLQAGERPDSARILADARKSIAWITAIRNGRESRATGFIIARPSDGKMVILTAGHIFQEKMILMARLPGMPDAVPCDLLAVSAKRDLMAVVPSKPIKAPALRLRRTKNVPLKLDERVVLIGCPGGLDWSHFPGSINAEPITAANLHSKLLGPEFDGKVTPSGDTLLLRHSCFSTPGMSGCPILDQEGLVLGVQLGTLPKASNVCFGVDARHIDDLDLDAKPKTFEGGPEISSVIGNVLPVEAPAKANPILIRVNGQEIDGRCLHLGYVPKDAETVMSRFIQDQERFRKAFSAKRLQKLLDATPVAHLTNPAFGFRMLVPKGFTYAVGRNVPNNGVIITLKSGNAGVDDPFSTITVRAYDNRKLVNYALAAFEEKVKKGQIPALNADNVTPFLKESVKRGYVHGIQVGMASSVFTNNTIKIRVKRSDGAIWGPDEGELFREMKEEKLSAKAPTRAWFNYDSTTRDMSHGVHYVVGEDFIAIVNYAFRTSERTRFFEGKEVDPAFTERLFIAATLSLY